MAKMWHLDAVDTTWSVLPRPIPKPEARQRSDVDGDPWWLPRSSERIVDRRGEAIILMAEIGSIQRAAVRTSLRCVPLSMMASTQHRMAAMTHPGADGSLPCIAARAIVKRGVPFWSRRMISNVDRHEVRPLMAGHVPSEGSQPEFPVGGPGWDFCLQHYRHFAIGRNHTAQLNRRRLFVAVDGESGERHAGRAGRMSRRDRGCPDHTAT